MQLERDQDYRSGGMRGPHPHADRDTAKDSSSKFHNAKKIQKYIQCQYEQDKAGEQLTMPNF